MPNFTVNIDETTSDLDVDEGQNINVVATVENTGDQEDTQNIEAEVDGTVRDTEENLTLDSGATQDVTLTFEAQASDDGETVTVQSTDDTDTATLSVAYEANFTVNIDETNSDLTAVEGENINAIVDVENTGGSEDTQNIEAVVGEEVRDSEEINLVAGNSKEITLSFESELADDNEHLTVESNDESDTATLSVLEEAFFKIEIDEEASNVEVEEGENVSIVLTAENTGEEEVTQDIVAEVDGVERDVHENLTLGDSASQEITLSFEAQREDKGENVVVKSEDDETNIALTITTLPRFLISVNETDSDLEPKEGENFIIVLDIENDGDQQGEQEIEAIVDGMVEDSFIAEIASGATEEITLSFASESLHHGEELTLSSEDDSEIVIMSVDTLAEFLVDIDKEGSIIDVKQGDTIEVIADIENVGEDVGTQNIYLDFIDEHDGTYTVEETDSQKIEDLAVDGSQTVIFTHEIPYDIQGENHSAKVYSFNHEDTVNVEAEVLYSEFEVKINELDSTDQAEPGDTVTVFVDIENVGNDEGTQNIELVFDDKVVDEDENRTVSAGSSKEIQMSFLLDEDENPGDHEVKVKSEDHEDTYELRVLGPGEYTVNILTVQPAQQIMGRKLTIEAEIENIDEVEGSKDVKLDMGEEERISEVLLTLGAGEKSTVEFETELDENIFEPGDIVSKVYTEDDSDEINTEIYKIIKEVNPKDIDELGEDVTVTVKLTKDDE